MIRNIISDTDKLKAIAADVRETYNAREQGDDWSAMAMKKHIKDTTDEELQRYSNEISSGVDAFNEKFDSIQQADAQGISTAQWMRDMLVQHADSAHLEQVEQSLANGNLNILETMQNKDGVYEVTEESLNKVDEQLNEAGYDETAREGIIAGIVRQAEATGAGTAVLGATVFPEDNQDVSTVENEMLDSDTGSLADKDLKIMASTVLKIGASTNKIPFLSNKTPTVLLANIACLGVEGSRTSKQLFDGKISASQAIDRMSYAACAATANLLICNVVPRALALLGPYGAITGTMLTPILVSANPEPLQRILHKGFEIVKPLAIPIIEKTVEFTREKWHTVKTTIKAVANGIKAIFA